MDELLSLGGRPVPEVIVDDVRLHPSADERVEGHAEWAHPLSGVAESLVASGTEECGTEVWKLIPIVAYWMSWLVSRMLLSTVLNPVRPSAAG